MMAERTNGKADYREQVDTWTDMPESGLRWPLYERLKGPSQYISDSVLPGYRAFTLEFMREMTCLGQLVLRVLALGLGQSENFFLDHFGEAEKCLHRMKWIHYPTPSALLADLCGVHEHKDSGFISLVLPGKPGLEVAVDENTGAKAETTRWQPAVAVPGAVIVNIGKSLQALTKGYYVATTHRVAHIEERYSAAFFYSPQLSMSLAPILHGRRYENRQAAGKDRARSDSAHLSSALSTSESTVGDLVVSLVSRSYPHQARTYLEDKPLQGRL